MSANSGIETLSGIYAEAKNNSKNPLTKEDIKGINLRLLLLVQLSSLQSNIAFEIEQIFREHNMFSFKIKHNHKKIVDFIKGCGNSKFWETLTQDQIDAICDDADTIEDIVYRWCGLK